MSMKYVGTIRHGLGKIPWMRSTRGNSFQSMLYGENRGMMLSHQIHHQIGMGTKSAGPSIFAVQRRMGVGRTPLHLKDASK